MGNKSSKPMHQGASETADEQFRLMIEAGDLSGLESALAVNPALANQSVAWFLNQNNESDPLHYVCDCVFNGWLEEPQALAIAALLINSGALVEGTKGRESPLIAATSLGTERIAKLLIDSGADLEATAVFGARPLHWAAAMGLTSTVEQLVQHGAELEARCVEFGSTPLYWAVFGFGPHGPNKKNNQTGAAKVLLEAGAVVDTRNNQGVSTLECAQQADSNEMYQLLVGYAKRL